MEDNHHESPFCLITEHCICQTGALKARCSTKTVGCHLERSVLRQGESGPVRPLARAGQSGHLCFSVASADDPPYGQAMTAWAFLVLCGYVFLEVPWSSVATLFLFIRFLLL